MGPIRLDKLHFRPNGHPVLNGVDLALDGEGITVMLGPNGAGKSVLLRTIAGLEKPDGGRITWNGCAAPAGRIAMVFQQPAFLRASVLENAGMGLKALGLGGRELRERCREVLQRVGLADRCAESARHLSGGERQRLALARCWAVRPGLLLLDEPTASLDPTATEEVERIIREIRTEGTKILMTTHNLGQATRLADDVVFVAGGVVCEHATVREFFDRPRSIEAKQFIKGEMPWQVNFVQ